MEQGKIPKFGAGAALGLVARELPEEAVAACGGTGTDRLVLLAKPHGAAAGHYVYMPVAVVPLQDLPEALRRQVAVGAGEQGAGAAAAGTNADAPALLPGQLQLHPVVPGGRLRQLAGAGSGTNEDAPIAGDEYSGRLILKAEEGGKAVYLNATTLLSRSDMMHGAADTDLGAFYDTGLTAPENGVPIVALLLQFSDPGAFDYSKSPPEDAAPFTETTLLGDGRAAELGAHYYDVLLPPPENLMPAVAGKASPGSRSPTYAVQVSFDAAASSKAGDPIAVVRVKHAAGVEAARGHGGLSALVGIVAAYSAATALAAGASGLVTAFGLLAVLVGGLSLAMAGVVAGV
ncbi:hypothetical protein BS78_07G067800 [Paspalum vaginatum]|nr:hypothetical protein BS78_07G067800 [Paspalum vaginatum]